jgi:hypothetical protein
MFFAAALVIPSVGHHLLLVILKKYKFICPISEPISPIKTAEFASDLPKQ